MSYTHRKIAQKLHGNFSSIDRKLYRNLTGVHYVAEVLFLKEEKKLIIEISFFPPILQINYACAARASDAL